MFLWVKKDQFVSGDLYKEKFKGEKMKKLFALAAVVFCASMVQAHPETGGHLKFSGGKVHAHLSWMQGPDENGGESIMKLEWYDGATHKLIETGLPFAVSLWMPSMGHGSAPTKIEAVKDSRGQQVLGTYKVSRMFFTMPGDWDIRVSLKAKDGTEETKAWSIKINGDGHGDHGDHGGHH